MKKAILGLIATALFMVAMAIQPWGAVDRGRQKKTMTRARAIGECLELQRRERGQYPTIERLVENPHPCGSVPTQDAWGNDFEIVYVDRSYFVISNGRDGNRDFADLAEYTKQRIIAFDQDIVYLNGAFVRWPEGMAQ